MSEIRRGALLSYATILVVNLSGLLLTPFIIRALGNSEYGLYLLVASLAAYLGVLDFGLNNAVTRYIAQSAAKNDRKQEARFLGAALVVNALAALAIICVGAIFYASVDTWFSETLDASARNQARTMLLLLIANVVFSVSTSMFTAICAGHERFTFPKSINLIRYAVRIGAVLLVLAAGGGAVQLVALDTALSFLMLIITALYVFRNMGARFDVRSIDYASVRSVLTFSIWVFLYAIIGQVQWQGGQIIIGATTGPESVAVYGIGIMFGTYYAAFSAAITSLFLPRATYMTVANASVQEFGAEMIRIGRMALLVLMLVLGGFALFGKEFLLLWAGPDYGGAWMVALIIMLAYTIPLIQTFAHQLLEAKGLVSFKAKVYMVALPLGLVLGYALLERLDILGMAIGLAFGWVLAIIVMNIYYHRVLGLNMASFFTGVFRGLVPIFIICIVIGGALNLLAEPSWINLAIRIAAFAGLYTGLMYRYGMNAGERQQANLMLNQFKKCAHRST